MSVNLQGLKSHVTLVIALLIVMLLYSCNNATNSDASRTDYQKVIDSAYHLYYNAKYDQAIHYFDSVTTRFKTSDPRQRYDYFALHITYYFHSKKDIAKSVAYTDSILNVFDTPEKKLKYLPEYGQCCFYKGDVLFWQNKYNEAYQYFYQGKLMASKSFNQCNLSDYSYRMGMILYRQEHYKQAAENFRSSWVESAGCPVNFLNFYRRQELLDNTGLSYSKISEADSATLYFKKAIDFIDTDGKQFLVKKVMLDAARGVIYGNEAKVYMEKGNYALAATLLRQSVDINLRKGNDNQDAELSELKLVHLYYQQNQVDSMSHLLNILHTQLDTTTNQGIKADWNLMMADYLIRKNEQKAAVNYLLQYNTSKDSAIAKNKALKDADINQQIQRLEKNNEFTNMKKDIQIRDLYLKLGAVLGFMLLAIFSLILVNWQKSRKNIKTLADLNRQIKDQNVDLEEALSGLKFSSEEKDRILRTVAHDLRNPLGGIASLTMVMEEDAYNADQKEMIGLIKTTSKNSLELINEIMEATDNTGASPLKKEMVDINSLISSSVELLRFKAAEKDQKIDLHLLGNPVELLISREKIWRVISNLITNAIKFSPVAGEIFVKVEALDKWIEFSIKDNGIGIPEKMKDKVFNMFTEAKRPGTMGERSFGLGLSICKQIIENHGGQISLESTVGSGTTFFVKLPKA